MSVAKRNPQSALVYLFIAIAIGLLAAIYYAPVWWVSLTAPNYPAEAFPDGVRIHFHMNGVFNGCEMIEKDEIAEDEALDCVHEMDTINHYVGMYPIAAGGVIERAFAPFLMGLLAVMLAGFAVPRPRARMLVMGVGFALLTAWMGLYFYADGGLKYQSEGYLEAMVSALDQGGGDAEAGEQRSSGQALIARLKAEMAEAMGEGETTEEAPEAEDLNQKQRYIENLRVTFEKDQERTGRDAEWQGSGAQLLRWHYQKSLGRYFNNPKEIEPMVSVMTGFAHFVFWALIGAMLLLIWGGRKNGGLFYWLLVLVPMALPLFFIIDYAGWLWWYGHSLNDMGAFTVKAFMPTVFGDGKVAQFATHSYPSIGFGLMVLMSVLLALSALFRRKEWKEDGPG